MRGWIILKTFIDYIFGLPFDFYFWDDDIIDFLNGLGINPTNKEFSKQESRNLYIHLIYREENPQNLINKNTQPCCKEMEKKVRYFQRVKIINQLKIKIRK